MAYERNPNDFDRAHLANDPYRPLGTDDNLGEPSRLDEDLRVDPEMAEPAVSGGRIAVYALAIAVVLGGVLYGLHNSTLDHPGTPSTAQNAAPAAAPRPNTAAGTTTGTAPAHPAAAPSSGPTGLDVNRAGNPPVNNTAPVENPPATK